MSNILWGIGYLAGAVLIFYFIYRFYNRYSEKVIEYASAFAILLVVLSGLSIWGGVKSIKRNNSSASEQSGIVGGYQQLGHKIKKSEAKEDKDGFYYTDKTDKNIRYFTDNDGTITAIKYSYMPNPEHTTAVPSELANLLDDSHLKYGNDKVDENKALLKGDNYNVYSPKHKKWYHMSMQKDDDGKVSEFSVWPGKEGQGEVE